MTKANLPPRIHIVSNPVHSNCSLDCGICFYLRKEQLFVDKRFRLNNVWCEFLRDSANVVGISVDGYRDVHKSVIRDLERLKRHAVDYQVLVSVDRHDADFPLQAYRFFRDDLEAEWLQFIPVIERVNDSEVSNRSVAPEQWGDFLIAVFDEWIANDVGRTFVQTFEVAATRWMGDCTHHDALPADCRECDVLFACQGECPQNRFTYTASGEPGLNYLCAGYKRFYRHIDKPMRILAQLMRQGIPSRRALQILAETENRH